MKCYNCRPLQRCGRRAQASVLVNHISTAQVGSVAQRAPLRPQPMSASTASPDDSAVPTGPPGTDGSAVPTAPDPYSYSRLMHLWEPVALLQPWQHCPPQTLTLQEQQRGARVRRGPLPRRRGGGRPPSPAGPRGGRCAGERKGGKN